VPFVNHTHYNPVRSKPITVSIETKLTSGNYQSAQAQLAVWVFAQFKYLRSISKGPEPPFLPLLVVQGDEWSFLAATQTPSSGYDIRTGEESQAYVTTIWDKIIIGSTASLEGVWKVSAVLQYLAVWSATDYLQWFYERFRLQDVWELPEICRPDITRN